MSDAARSYIPAAGHDWLLPFYDPLLRLLGAHAIREAMVEDADPKPGMCVLDVGCGTGSLVAELVQHRPGVEVTGLDPDPLALARARRKLDVAGLEARFDEGFADDLPYADASFDQVFSSFMFHHLERNVKEGMLREVRRVLAAEGQLHLVDFGGEKQDDGFFTRFFHSHDELADNFSGTIPELMKAAGFRTVRPVSTRRSLIGRVTHYEAR